MSIGFSVNYLVWLISYRSFLNVSSSSEGFYLFVDHLLDFPTQFLDILNISILASFFCPLLAIEYSSFLCFHIVPSLPVSAYFLFLNHFSSSQHTRLEILAIFFWAILYRAISLWNFLMNFHLLILSFFLDYWNE